MTFQCVILCVMQSGVLTSVRLPVPLRHELDRVAQRLNRRPNWVISEALREYLEAQKGDLAFAEQARKESLKAAQLEKTGDWDQELWERNIDVAGWQ